MVRGEGVRVFDESGRPYIDAIAGLWSASLGYGEEELVQAAIQQMRTLAHFHVAMNRSTPPVIELAEKLKQIAPGEFSKVFFVSSGSEANETQIKLHWYWANATGHRLRKKFITLGRSYHGCTVATGSLSGSPVLHQEFDLPLPFVRYVTPPLYSQYSISGESEREFVDRLLQELRDTILEVGPDSVAAFVAEPVLGAGGVIVPPKDYFGQVQRLLEEYGIRLIADEVITGFGRTGEMWGSQTMGLRPASLSCAKALSAGYMPIGAVLIDEELYSALLDQSGRLGEFAHGFTFGGHPTAAAVALRTIEIMEERDVLGHVRSISPLFQGWLESLSNHPIVAEARGVGLIGGIELRIDAGSVSQDGGALGRYCSQKAESHGVIVRPLGDTIALCPPLVIEPADIEELFSRLQLALDDTLAWAESSRTAG